MANRWETMETVRDFIWGGSKITADGECSHEKETMSFSATEMDPEIIILSEVSQKEKDKYYMISLILCCWRRLLRVPWTARRSNKSILKEINSEYSLEGLMLKLKLQLWPPDAKN